MGISASAVCRRCLLNACAGSDQGYDEPGWPVAIGRTGVASARQRRYGLVDGRHANLARDQMQLVAAHVLEARRIRRSPKEHREVLDPLHVVMLGLRR